MAALRGVLLLVRLAGVRVVRIALLDIVERRDVHVLHVHLRSDRNDLDLALITVVLLATAGGRLRARTTLGARCGTAVAALRGVLLLVCLAGVRVVRIALLDVVVRGDVHVLHVHLRSDRNDLDLLLIAVVLLPAARRRRRARPAPSSGAAVACRGRVLLLVCLTGVRVVGVALFDVAASRDVRVLHVHLRSDRNDLDLLLIAVVRLRSHRGGRGSSVLLLAGLAGVRVVGVALFDVAASRDVRVLHVHLRSDGDDLNLSLVALVGLAQRVIRRRDELIPACRCHADARAERERDARDERADTAFHRYSFFDAFRKRAPGSDQGHKTRAASSRGARVERRMRAASASHAAAGAIGAAAELPKRRSRDRREE